MPNEEMKLIEKRKHTTKYTGDVDEPWFTRGAITFLNKVLNKNMVAIEYGCGTSTIWYVQKVKRLTSIEHDKKWFDKMNKYLQLNDIKNVDLIYADLYDGYVNMIDEMGMFDLISVDGRRRSDCISHAHKHVRIGGYLLLDNAERGRYQDAIKHYISNWKRFDFSNGIWLTSIFQNIK